MDNSSNVCGLEFNYKNGEKEGDSSLEEEKEDKKLEEGEETKQDKMEGLEGGDILLMIEGGGGVETEIS